MRGISRKKRNYRTKGVIATLIVLVGVAACADTPAPEPSATPSPSIAPITLDSGVTMAALTFPPGMIGVNNKGDSGIATQMHSVLALPEEDGPRPVVFVLHGTHDPCPIDFGQPKSRIAPDAVTAAWPLVCLAPDDPPEMAKHVGPKYVRHDTGMSYLVQRLAEQGFVAMSIDVMAVKAGWANTGTIHETENTAALVQRYLELLAQWNAEEDDGLPWEGLKNTMDLQRVALVGHSTGGSYVTTDQAGKTPGLFAAVALQPAGSVDAGPLVPILALSGSCDADTGPQAGTTTLAAMRAVSGDRRPPMLDAQITGIGHTVLNTSNKPEIDPALCTPQQEVDHTVARDQVAGLVAGFLNNVLQGQPTDALPQRSGVELTVKNILDGATVSTSEVAPGPKFLEAAQLPDLVSRMELLAPVPPSYRVDKDWEADF